MTHDAFNPKANVTPEVVRRFNHRRLRRLRNASHQTTPMKAAVTPSRTHAHADQGQAMTYTSLVAVMRFFVSPLNGIEAVPGSFL